MIVAIVPVYTRCVFNSKNRDALYSFLPFLPYLVWKWKKELRYFTDSESCFHLSTVELFFPSKSKVVFRTSVSIWEESQLHQMLLMMLWSFDLYYLTRWAIEPEMAPLGDVAHPHNNLVHPSLAVNVWTETKYNIATINLLNQFLPLNKIRLPKRNSRMLRPLIAKKQNRLFRKGKLPITCDWYSFFKFQ